MSISPTRSSLGSFERRKRRVVAVLGGNALVRPGDRPSMEGQLRRAREALEQLAPLLDDDTQLLISHGNGPQVGHILTRVEQALGKAYALPLEVCVAESEGELGYVLEQALANVLTAQGRRRASAVLLSQVVVDAADPALSHPTKPIGVFYSEQEADALRRRGFAMTEDAGRGWRRVVPSPRPVEVLGVDVIRTLLDAGTIVIAAGGGGIPVVRSGSQLAGLEAVIDKDLTGALLADRLDADLFVILTDVPCAYRDYRQPSQAPIGRIDDAGLQQLFDAGHFAAGSMGPKVEAALQFVRGGGGRRAIICNPEGLGAALVGDAGTYVVRTNEAIGAAAFASAKGKADGAENSSSTDKSNVAVASDAPVAWDGAVESAESLEPGESNEPAESAGARGAAARPSSQFNCLILGAAGRDFHNFQTFFRAHPEFRVRAFTATQIPFIEQRSFPKSLAGPAYDSDIPIFAETRLPELIRDFDIDFVFLAYSDLSHAEVMHRASLVQACGASFALLGPDHTQIVAHRPVISVTAVRTGAGKSPLTQWIARELTAAGRRVGILRHPMPYGDLARQAVQRFADWSDLDRHGCTVEEREEYEPYIEQGQTIWAGVDYASIVAQARAESDVLLWDGGNNDFSFLRPSLSIVVADALRAGHESTYYPGETNIRSADVVVINKIRSANSDQLARLRSDIRVLNPRAVLIDADLDLRVEPAGLIAGRRVLVIEDGPTLTHGGMSFGAGTLAAQRAGAAELVDPRPFAVGTIAEAYRQHPHMGRVLPALGYSETQRAELAETIRRTPADVVVDASPSRVDRVLTLDKPLVRVSYRFVQLDGPSLRDIVLHHLVTNISSETETPSS